MKYILLFLLIPATAFPQFKYDNVLYKTVNWQQFCSQFLQQKDALLLDVRSNGEFADTSPSRSLNIGHLNGATHINVSELGKRLPEITAYKNKPVYIYCSHSQRSRRSSKMLADSGFTNVINVNGGLTALYLTDQSTVPCKSLVETNNSWQQYNPQQVAELLKENPGIAIIEVRTDSAFNGLSKDEKEKALGMLKGSINIPLQVFKIRSINFQKTNPYCW
ncbi:MAG: rhodanese-like domain-containing protein [Bacteroidota bacterium]